MPNKGWKQFERDAAALILGTRFWSNSGEKLDIIGHHYVGQCKNVERMSLREIIDLSVEAEDQAAEYEQKVRSKMPNPDPWFVGLLFIRKKRSKKTLVVMTAEEFVRMRRMVSRAMEETP